MRHGVQGKHPNAKQKSTKVPPHRCFRQIALCISTRRFYTEGTECGAKTKLSWMFEDTYHERRCHTERREGAKPKNETVEARTKLAQKMCRGCNLGCANGTTLLKTFAAKYRPTLRGTEGDGSLLATLRTIGFGFRTHGRGSTTAPFRALGFTAFTAFRFVLKTLVGEKHLFAAGKNKLGATF